MQLLFKKTKSIKTPGLSLLLCLAILLGGCGQKGPLTLPEKAPANRTSGNNNGN
jgi:predicted small lipoprotein YifL